MALQVYCNRQAIKSDKEKTSFLCFCYALLRQITVQKGSFLCKKVEFQVDF